MEMDHIAEWKRINRLKAEADALGQERREEAEKKRIVKIKEFLAGHEAENVMTNGYVWDFDYKGMSGHFCDQTDRVFGAVHRPFFSDEDAECYRDMESDMMRGEAGYYVTEYCYQHFCIDGKPWRSLKRVFELIENAVTIRRQG